MNSDTDIPLWRRKNNAYKHMFSSSETWYQIRVRFPIVNWDKGVWFPHATPKFSFIAWLALKNRLATGERMRSWNLNVNVGCTFCDEVLETREHLFFSCVYSKAVWEALVGGLLKQNHTHAWIEVIEAISSERGNRITRFLLCYAFQSTLYFLWRERNRRRHGENSMNTEGLIKAVDMVVRNRILSVQRQDDHLEGAMLSWFEARMR